MRSWWQWKWFLLEEVRKGGIIFDEYDEPIKPRKFFKKIEAWSNEHNTRNHAEMMIKDIRRSIDNYNNSIDFTTNSMSLVPDPKELERYWVDDEGYSFTEIEFS